MREYDEIADWYASNRDGRTGVADVAAAVRDVTPGAKILDLGCGNGTPIAQFLLNNGFEVFGVDSSHEMIERFRKNCPAAHAECACIQESDLFDTEFDAVVAWGVLFHLTPADQDKAISKVLRVLKPGGTFLFTSGEQEGTAESRMNGVLFHYASQGSANYRTLLNQHGFDLLDEHSDDCANYVYVARKRAV
jgi:cyclopropane fatty-acyl-phospholipid synthase-like methyltransferase